MFGDQILVAPVLYAGVTEQSVYLPDGKTWLDAYTGKSFEGGQTISISVTMQHIPVFVLDAELLPVFQNR